MQLSHVHIRLYSLQLRIGVWVVSWGRPSKLNDGHKIHFIGYLYTLSARSKLAMI